MAGAADDGALGVPDTAVPQAPRTRCSVRSARRSPRSTTAPVCFSVCVAGARSPRDPKENWAHRPRI